MLVPIIFFSGLCYWMWKKTEKIKSDCLPIHPRRLFYLPIIQCVLCVMCCIYSFSFDGNLPKDEINQFAERYEIVNDLSSALLGLDLTTDQVTMYMITQNLHSKAIYILIGSIIMMLIQTIGAYKKSLDKLIIEGIAAIHTICYFYIGKLLVEALHFWINQMGTMKLINAIQPDDSSPNIWWIMWFVPFHYLYHYVIEKYYSESKLIDNQ